MAKATKSKRSAKPRAKRKVIKPLLAATADVRKTKPRAKARRSPSVEATATVIPGLAAFDFMGRVISAYAELPARLAACRSPMDFWREQARFAQRILNQSQLAATTSSSMLEIKRTRARH
jgi:hypothetical protein